MKPRIAGESYRLLEKSPRDWILMMLDMANALRPSELFCLRWRSFLEVPLLLGIQETLYKGNPRAKNL